MTPSGPTTVALAPEVPKSSPRKSASSSADGTVAALTDGAIARMVNAERSPVRREERDARVGLARSETTPVRVSGPSLGLAALGIDARGEETPRPVATDASPARATIDDAATTSM